MKKSPTTTSNYPLIMASSKSAVSSEFLYMQSCVIKVYLCMHYITVNKPSLSLSVDSAGYQSRHYWVPESTLLISRVDAAVFESNLCWAGGKQVRGCKWIPSSFLALIFWYNVYVKTRVTLIYMCNVLAWYILLNLPSHTNL